jgi:hypothetical protein
MLFPGVISSDSRMFMASNMWQIPARTLDQYFDIVNGRLFSRSVPTQLAVLYLFGSGKHYRPNTGALSASGEAIAGFCMEQFGYRPLVRPLGIMPDAVLWTN